MMPKLVLCCTTYTKETAGRGVGVTIINFNTARQTLRCIESLRPSQEPPDWILVLDNGSEEADWHRLLAGAGTLSNTELRIYRSEENLGFAAGSNFLVQELLREPRCRYIGLLNNDAVALPGWTRRLANALDDKGPMAGLAGARMHELLAPTQVDSLGITVYSSLMPADRKCLIDPLLGPTGGCCMLTRRCADHLVSTIGYFYDPRFFCYCEDTDLAMRAILLGLEPVYIDEVLALHEGQGSTGSRYNTFITYHGLRNILWMHWKLVPSWLWWRHSPLILLAHVLSIVRHVLSGHPGLVWRLYRDAFRRRREFRLEYHTFRQHVKISPQLLQSRLSSGFYRRGYAGIVLRQIARSWLDRTNFL
jgi:GT2 family glycosyltransferase